MLTQWALSVKVAATPSMVNCGKAAILMAKDSTELGTPEKLASTIYVTDGMTQPLEGS